MNNFTFQNATKIIFGKNAEASLGTELALQAKKVLLHYGGKSSQASGLLDRVRNSLEDAQIPFVELGSVQANPRLDLVQKGIDLVRQEQIDFILAVGGGSVIDSAKAIALGVPYSGNVWDFFEYTAEPLHCMKLGVVLTIPAAGSESSPSTVISNEEKKLKRGLTNNIMRPVFAFLNPELSFTLPPYQTACGATDIMSHIMERYFSDTPNVEFTDRLCEASLKTLIQQVPRALENPIDYAARAEIMWAGCVAHNDILGTGRNQSWACHAIEHELSAL